MNDDLRKKYNDASRWYEHKYVKGGWKKNHYMKDELDAYNFWMDNREDGKIISLGVGSGQDIEILGSPDPSNFVGYDISEGMLKNAMMKFQAYTFYLRDCNTKIEDSCDILVSMFGTPNYIGLEKLLEHYKNFNAKHAFFIFYDENYYDGIADGYHTYTIDDLRDRLSEFKPIVKKLNENYYIVKW